MKTSELNNLIANALETENIDNLFFIRFYE